MGTKKFSQFTDGSTGQSPTDTLVGLDLSQPTSARNTYWTLNSLFSKITRNITDKTLRFQSGSTPIVAGNDESSLYSDGRRFLASSNGGAYFPLDSLPVYNVQDYGAAGDAITYYTGAINSSSFSLTITGASLTAADQGKTIIVAGAGTSGRPLQTTIQTVNSATNATLALAASTTVSGARVDYGTLDLAAFQSATAAVPARGGVLWIPGGRYMLGSLVSAPNRWVISRGNISVRGAGIGSATLLYSSAYKLDAVISSGSCLSVNLFDSGTSIENVFISGLTFEDLNSGSAATGANDPSTINACRISNFRLENCSLVNGKGNAAFTLLGDQHPVTNEPLTTDVYVKDCFFIGTSVGGWIEGDAVNCGAVKRIYVTGNYMTGTSRHGYEGGAKSTEQYIAFNTVDMQLRGFAGINPTGGNKTVVANNLILNTAVNWAGIDFTSDLGSLNYSLLDNLISENYVAGNGNTGIKIQNTGGSGTAVSRFRVLGNYFSIPNGVGIIIGAADFPALWVEDNVFELNTGSTRVLAQTGAPGGSTPIPPRVIAFARNISNVGFIDFQTTFSNWKNYTGIRVEDNIIGSTLADNQTGEYGGCVATNAGAGGSLAAGSSQQIGGTITMYGAIPGDECRIAVDNSWPAGLQLWARVTAQDTINCWVFNPTSSPLTIPDFTHPVYIFLKRY